MSKILCRGTVAQAAVMLALLWSRPANAQVTNDPGPPREPGGLGNNLVTGVHYDVKNQALAARRIQHLQTKLRRDAESCNPVALDRDVCRIDNLRFRIVVDEWLIRKNLLLDPGCYPYPVCLDPMSAAAIGQYRRP